VGGDEHYAVDNRYYEVIEKENDLLLLMKKRSTISMYRQTTCTTLI